MKDKNISVLLWESPVISSEEGISRRSHDKNVRMGKTFRISGLLLIILFILLSPFTACTKVNMTFFNQVLNNFDTNSYYVALNIKSDSYKGRAIIENNNLYSFLNKTKGLNKEQYQSFMRKILAHDRSVRIDDKDLAEGYFIKVPLSESVIRTAYRGKDNFIANYFNGVVLNYGITDVDRNAIINQLFYWEVPSRIDKISGQLIIGW